MVTIILVVLTVLLVVAPIIAALMGFVHAIIDSVSKKRFPSIVAIILVLLAIGVLAVWQYGDHLYSSTGGVESLNFLGLVWSNLRLLLIGVTFTFAIVGLTWYIFLSFREDSVPSFRSKKSKDDKTKETTETDGEIRESNRRTAILYRVLTVVVATVILGIILGVLYLGYSLLNSIITHDLSEYTSPDGQYTIVVDNLQQGELYGGDIYLRLNPFKVRKLQEKENRRKFMDIGYEDITWEDQGVRIPYGNLDLFYYYEPVQTRQAD